MTLKLVYISVRRSFESEVSGVDILSECVGLVSLAVRLIACLGTRKRSTNGLIAADSAREADELMKRARRRPGLAAGQGGLAGLGAAQAILPRVSQAYWRG